MLDLADLAAWRETLMIHARGFIFSQRRKGRKGFLLSVGLGGLGGLARDINDSRARIYFLAKAQRTQRNSNGMQDLAGLAAWRETLMIKREDYFLAKARRPQRNSYGMQDLADLAAWREIIQARDFCSRKGAEAAKESYGMLDLADLAAWREIIQARDFCSRKGAEDAKVLVA